MLFSLSLSILLSQVEVFDHYGNVIGEDAKVSVRIYKNTPNAPLAVSVVYVPSTEVWSVVYTAPDSGAYELEVSVQGKVIRGGALVITVDPFLSPGIIAAIVLSCVAFVAIVIGIVLLIRRKKRIYQAI